MAKLKVWTRRLAIISDHTAAKDNTPVVTYSVEWISQKLPAPVLHRFDPFQCFYGVSTPFVPMVWRPFRHLDLSEPNSVGECPCSRPEGYLASVPAGKLWRWPHTPYQLGQLVWHSMRNFTYMLPSYKLSPKFIGGFYNYPPVTVSPIHYRKFKPHSTTTTINWRVSILISPWTPSAGVADSNNWSTGRVMALKKGVDAHVILDRSFITDFHWPPCTYTPGTASQKNTWRSSLEGGFCNIVIIRPSFRPPELTRPGYWLLPG